MEIHNLSEQLRDEINEFIDETIYISGNGLFINENSLAGFYFFWKIEER